MSSNLKLVILYNATANTYAIFDHNLAPEDAEKHVAELREKQLLAIAVNQRAQHIVTDAQACRTCRRDVGRSADLQSKPKFERRKEE
jgi:hypothetical protein